MKTKLHREIDGILAELKARGHDIKRSDIIESVAKARGHRNAHEMMAAAKKSEEAQSRDHPFSAEGQGKDHRDIEIEQLRLDIENMEKMCIFDWAGWNKTIKAMKKMSHHGKDPISDEDLMLVRMAVSDNHCKSSSRERSEAEHRVMELAKKRMSGILARLDRAEEAMGNGETFKGPILQKIRSAFRVEATRDGAHFEKTFFLEPEEGLSAYEKGVEIAAGGFGIGDLHTLAADEWTREERIEELAADMDRVEVSPAYVTIDVSEAVQALERGEGSVLLHRVLLSLGQELGLDPRGTKGIIYPKAEG